MNPTKLMAVALCAAACVTTTAFAEDDFGIESATPVAIADPVNPQPGMMFRAYHRDKYMNAEGLKGSISSLPSLPAVKTLVDKGEEYSLKQVGNASANIGMWSGFMKCKRAGSYTLTLSQPANWNNKRMFSLSSGGYSLKINGKLVIPVSMKQTSVDVDLKVGWNKVDLVCQFGRAPALTIVYKPKDSLSDARPLTPAMMFFDKKPEEDW